MGGPKNMQYTLIHIKYKKYEIQDTTGSIGCN